MENNTQEIVLIDNASKQTEKPFNFFSNQIDVFYGNISDKIEKYIEQLFKIEIWHQK